jgi:hypothetical protein
LADFAVKKYRSHRRISQQDLMVAEAEKREKDKAMETKAIS